MPKDATDAIMKLPGPVQIIDPPEYFKALEAQREKIGCPLCENPLDSLRGIESRFQYWCPKCQHGWHIADIKNFLGMCLQGKREKARQIIIDADKGEG
uniref:Uncharacterized protein n=1 Tax=viral metagenome TaxID=1070528 RepID=A0A6M3J9Y3_9ZZZZ